MDSNTIMLAILFGLVGTGFVMYAKSAGRLMPAIAGIALMIFPYFVTNVWLMILIGAAVTAVPFFFRDS